MTYPGAIIFPAHPSNTLGPPNIPKGFVLHTPEEPADGYPGTPHWFAQEHPQSPGSTTWFIATNGDVYECVAEDIAPIANGVIGKPYPAWADPNRSLNRQTHSVEIEGYAATIGQTLNAEQRASLISLIRYDAAKYGYPIDRQHIIGHYEVANNRSDPGTLDIQSIVDEANQVVQSIEEDDMPDPVFFQSNGLMGQVGPMCKTSIGNPAHAEGLIAGGAKRVDVPDGTLESIPDIVDVIARAVKQALREGTD